MTASPPGGRVDDLTAPDLPVDTMAYQAAFNNTAVIFINSDSATVKVNGPGYIEIAERIVAMLNAPAVQP
jgi:hypothetical protein